MQWDEASDTDRHKHSNLGTGAGQGRIIMKEAFLKVGYENCIILIKYCQHQDIGGPSSVEGGPSQTHLCHWVNAAHS